MKRIIVCGFGFMGQNHAANIFANPDLELAAVVDARPKAEIKPVKGNVKTASFEWEKLNEIPFYATLTEALKKCSADAVLIASPTAFHIPLALEAIANGKHVFVEKPMCLSMEEAASVQAALKGKNLIFQVGHCVRFFREYQILAEAIRGKQYGALKFLKLNRMTGRPNWGAWKDLDTSLLSTAGPLFDLNIHDIDFALSSVGIPDEITAEKRPAESDMLFRSDWKYRDGSIVRVEGGFILPSTVPFRSEYTAVFEHGVMEYDSRCCGQIVVSAESGCTKIETKMEYDPFYAELEEFAQSMIGGVPVRCDADEAARTIGECFLLMDLLRKN